MSVVLWGGFLSFVATVWLLAIVLTVYSAAISAWNSLRVTVKRATSQP